MTFHVLQFLLAGWLLNVTVCAPYWWFIERRACLEGKQGSDVELALSQTCLGTIALCAIPWLGGLLYLGILAGALLWIARGRKP